MCSGDELWHERGEIGIFNDDFWSWLAKEKKKEVRAKKAFVAQFITTILPMSDIQSGDIKDLLAKTKSGHLKWFLELTEKELGKLAHRARVPFVLNWFLNLTKEELEKLAKVQPEHLGWFLGLTERARDKLSSKIRDGKASYGGVTEFF